MICTKIFIKLLLQDKKLQLVGDVNTGHVWGSLQDGTPFIAGGRGGGSEKLYFMMILEMCI